MRHEWEVIVRVRSIDESTSLTKDVKERFLLTKSITFIEYASTETIGARFGGVNS